MGAIIWGLCRNGSSCQYLARGRCRYKHLDPETELRLSIEPTTEEEKEQRLVAEEKREEHKKILNKKKKEQKRTEVEKRQTEAKQIADEKKEVKRKADEKKRAEEKQTADEACSRLAELPGEQQVLILHHMPLKQLQNLELPIHLLRLVLQAKEPGGVQQLVKSSWLDRLRRYEDKVILLELAKKADLVPVCDVIRPSLYSHTCSLFCSWFAPEGGWEAFYAKNPEDHYVKSYRSDEEGAGNDEYDYRDDRDYYDDYYDFHPEEA